MKNFDVPEFYQSSIIKTIKNKRKSHDLKKYDWQKPHQHNLTGTEKAYYPNKNKNVLKKKYKSWEN